MPEEQNDRQGESRQSFFAKQQLINSAKSAFQLLAAVLKNSTLYPVSHPFVLASAEKFLMKINELLVDRKEVPFYLVGGELFFEKDTVPLDQSLAILMELFTGRDIGGIVFKPGLSTEEITAFADLMNKDAAAFHAEGGVDELMPKAQITHIVLHRLVIVDKKIGNVIKEGKKRAAEVFMDAIETMKEMIEAQHLDKKSNMRKMNTTVQTMVDNILENRDTYIGLTNLKMYDEYTFAHSVNTSLIASSFGTFLHFEKPQVAALGMAGLLHDMGKASIPHEIVNKPGKLTDAEWEVLKRHPVEGALLLADTPGVTKMAMVAAFEHHQHGERGYPDIKVRQHLFSQIISLADAYDAITAARVYYSIQTPPDKAIRILLKKRGTSFDPVLVKAFVNMMGIFPVGTVLKLNTGEVGLVMHQTRDLMRPRVLLLTRFDGSEKESGGEVNLLEGAGGKFKRSIAGTIDPYVSHIDLKKYLT
jgi:HD-GYP domain-containing protein (c-di-GMP phosphodiesterase class II)